ncbi:hypothetical protein FKZ61_014885 [Litorilinea aerophila]|uniref:Uncharacterized protein n=1 Tax=Litorilinea aerophila TaxID=1204385 RepID=A0A540VDP3_9CHLR|nr:hypothetical protein [Litorilinea aerophila]MCC9077389.1 hypothetical protein [Litorilinea aerophila]OUC08927.1 hypothetical protein RY27_06075 [Litorilinea aerophila]
MNLETRVETLEHELKILKNEIRQALLDIQEHILNRQYPALRSQDPEAEEPETPASRLSGQEPRSGEERGRVSPLAHVLKDVESLREFGLTEADLLEDDDEFTHEAPPPVARRAAGKSTNGNGHPAAGGGPGHFTALATWVSQSVERIGKERTRKAVETYAQGGYLADHHRALLLQLVELAEDQEPTAPVSPRDTFDMLMQLSEVLEGKGRG